MIHSESCNYVITSLVFSKIISNVKLFSAAYIPSVLNKLDPYVDGASSLGTRASAPRKKRSYKNGRTGSDGSLRVGDRNSARSSAASLPTDRGCLHPSGVM